MPRKDLTLKSNESSPNGKRGLEFSSLDKLNEVFQQVKSLQHLSQDVYKDFEGAEDRLDKHTQEAIGKKMLLQKLVKSFNIFSPTSKNRRESDTMESEIINNYNSLKEAMVIANFTLKQLDSLKAKLEVYDAILYEINESYLELFNAFGIDPGPQ